MRNFAREPELLFYKYDIFSVMDAHRNGVRQIVQNLEGNRLLNTPTEDLIQYAVDKFAFHIPELHLEQAHVDPREEEIEINDYGRVVRVLGTVIELTVPFSGDKDFFFIRPTSFNSAPPRAIITDNCVVITVRGRNLDQQQVKSSLDRAIQAIQQYLDWQKKSANELNRSLIELARSEIEARKAKLLKDRNLVAGLGFPMRQRDDASKTYVAPQVRRKLEPKLPSASTAPFAPEPVLDETHYKHILGVIENMAVMMERSPSAFAHMDEEAIRDQFLVPLNGHYEGAASGETFNFQGKTDILIRDKGRNIFIGECKFWRGEKAFIETVDQVLGYLSWRDTKAAIILFNRNRNFSQVLTKAREAMEKHLHKKRGPVVESETRFRYVFGNPSDHSREIILTVLAFDIPTPAKAT